MVGGLGRKAGRRAGLADGRHAGADRQLAGDEVGAPRRAACLGRHKLCWLSGYCPHSLSH